MLTHNKTIKSKWHLLRKLIPSNQTDWHMYNKRLQKDTEMRALHVKCFAFKCDANHGS